MDDSTVSTVGGDTAELLARRLRDAVMNLSNGNGGAGAANGGSNGAAGNGIARERARSVASDVGAAILAEASTGTAKHSDDVVLITEAIGERMKVEGEDAADLLAAARLHDIGKAWIPPELLEKPGSLSESEWEMMRKHTLVGERILSAVEELGEVARLVRHSHERWDGGGYPDHLAGREIPLGSRIIFCADAFHAIRCDRPYRAGRSAAEALAEVKRCAGTQFDPKVARALEQVVRERDRKPLRGGGSARLLALLMCLVVGIAGSAVARSGLLPEPSAVPAASSSPAPSACGSAGCPSAAGPAAEGSAAPLTSSVLPATLAPKSGTDKPDTAGGGKPAGAARENGQGESKHAKGQGKGKHNAKGKAKGKGKHAGAGASALPGHSGEARGHSSDGPATSQVSPSHGSSGSSHSGGGHGSAGRGSTSKGKSGSRSRKRGSRGSTQGNGNGNANGHSK